MTHALSGLALGAPLASSSGRDRIWLAGAVCAALPDVDVIGFRFGVHYGDLLGHRGLTHSLAFAVALSSLVVVLTRARWHDRAVPLWLYLFVATASHGCLDALTDGGLGVAFFSPFSNARYFFPVRPIAVSPIGLAPFASGRGIAVLWSEIRWVWLPFGAFAATVLALRPTGARRREGPRQRRVDPDRGT